MQIGDKVKFVNESLEGIITRLIDAKMIGVSIEDGFEIPVLKSEIMVVANGNAIENNNKKEAPKNNVMAGANVENEISVLFEQSSITWYRALLVNNTRHDILLSVSHKQGNRFKALFAGRVEKNTSYLFNTLNFEEMNQWGAYCFRIIFHEMESEVPRAPWYLEYTFKSKNFSQPKEVNGKPVYLIPLKPDKIEQFTLAKEQVKIESKAMTDQINITRPEEVIDIHIHQLVKHYSEISADEAISIQMNHFKNMFEKALALNYFKITFIHGVGTGVLKQKIWKEVSGHPAVKTFYEAKKEKFGYGATEIVFR